MRLKASEYFEMLKKFLFIALLVHLVSGCDVASTIKEGMAQSNIAAAAIEKQVGVKPEVGFNYQNGALVAVTVQFSSAPSISIADLERVSHAAVLDAFKDEPANLVLSFVFKKAA